MGINTRAASAFTKPLEIVFDGIGTLHVRYRPAAVTPARERQFLDDMRAAATDNRDTTLPWLSRVCEVIAEWDLDDTDADGTVRRVPITPAALEEVPSILISGAWDAIQEDQRTHPLRLTPSANGSGPGGDPASARNGTASSAPRGSFT